MQNKKNHTAWGLIFRIKIHYTHWPHPEGRMIQKTLHTKHMTLHDKHPDTTPSPSRPKDEPGRTPSPTYSTNCESTTWNLQNTRDTRLSPTTKYATLLFLPKIDPPRKNRTRNQCKQTKQYRLGIDISKEDTLHTLTTPREKDDTENLANHTHDFTWQTPGHNPLTIPS